MGQANSVNTGLWECSPGSFDVLDRDNTESIYILSGRIRLTDLKAKGDKGRILEKGDAAVLECGSSVRWEVLETVQKFFVVSPKAMTGI